MLSLEQNLKQRKRGLANAFGGATITVALFLCMGLMHFDIKVAEPEEVQPISEFHLPPPPPPPEIEQPPQQNNLSVSLNLPVTQIPTNIPVGYLDVDFGLTPQALAQTNVNVDTTLDNFKTDGLDALKIYSQSEVTEKPKRKYQGELSVPPRIRRLVGQKPVTVILLYTVTDEGRVTNIHVLDCPFPELVPYFERYVRDWRLKPAMKDGRPVNCWAQHKFIYRAAPADPYSL